MKKVTRNKAFALLFISLLLVSSFAMFASAQPAALAPGDDDPADPATTQAADDSVDTPAEDAPSSTSSSFVGRIGESFAGFFRVWEKGAVSDDKDINLIGAAAKWLILLLIITLVYSSLSFANFPDHGVPRFILSVIVGFLATLLITQGQILSIIESYKGLGIAITIFFPIAILGFFSLVAASKGSPIGIYLQKILWIIYSAYLFLRAGLLLLLKNADVDTKGKLTSGFLKFFVEGDTPSLLVPAYDSTILIILLVVAVAAFVIGVVSNKPITAWLAREKIMSEAEAQKSRIERSKEYDKVRSEAMQDT